MVPLPFRCSSKRIFEGEGSLQFAVDRAAKIDHELILGSGRRAIFSVARSHFFVVFVCAVDVVEQRLVGNLFFVVDLPLEFLGVQRELAHATDLALALLATFPVGKHAPPQERIQLLLV